MPSLLVKLRKNRLFAALRQLMKKTAKNPRAAWLLGFLLVIAGLVLASYPLWPPHLEKETSYSYLPSGVPAEDNVLVEPEVKDLPPAEGKKENNQRHHIIIPKMGVDADLLSGGIEKLSQGVWLLPNTSTPDKGGNTVISAHRWKYRPPDPRTFYNIDKLAVGDEIKIFWQGKIYYYRVKETKVVTPDQTEILYPTKEPQLTLFSCTPLFSTSHRLVVVAGLKRVE